MNVMDLNVPERNVYFGLTELTHMCHGASYSAGWWKDLNSGIDLRDEVRNGTRFGKALVAEKLVLIHSEISEAMEGARKNLKDDKLPQHSMLMTELADAVIRIADLVGALGQEDFAQILLEKLAFNRVRPDHKIENRIADGGKAF